MNSRRPLKLLIVALVATPVLLLLAIGSAGAGHGDYVLARVLFPFTLLSAAIFGSITIPFVALAIVQFPLYGLLLSAAEAKGRLGRQLFWLSLIHALAVGACFVVFDDQFF